MALIPSNGTGGGLWNAGASWVGGVPTAADTWVVVNGDIITIAAELTNNPLGGTINSGGQLTVAFQMSTSYINGNITVASGGKLYANRAASNKLRIAGSITANGAESVDYGTALDPISTTTVGAAIEYICTSDVQASRGLTLGINNGLTAYGVVRTQETTLSAVAAIGANTIVLVADMALRPGTLAQWADGEADMILVAHTPTQTANGAQNDEMDLYLVGNYDPVTHTVTLADAGAGQTYWPRGGVTPTWNTIHQTQREIGTPVYLVSANVVFRGTAYNLRPTVLVNGVFSVSTYVGVLTLWGAKGLNSLTGCTPTGAIAGCDSGINGCTNCAPSGVMVGNSNGLNGCSNCAPTGTISGNSYGLNSCTNCAPTGAISGNSSGLYACLNCAPTGTISGNNSGLLACRNCAPTGAITGNTSGLYACDACRLPGNTMANTYDLNRCADVRACNVAFGGGTEHYEYTNVRVWPSSYCSSEDHDQQPGAFRAWTRGGTVDSNLVTVPPGRTHSYQHALASATYWCFRQDQVLVEAGDTLRVTAWFRKDAAMAVLPKLELIDLFEDPLVSAAFTALTTATMTNSINTWETLTVTWTNTDTAARQILVRASGKDAAGNLYEDWDMANGGTRRGVILGSG